ncbi:hypothetical protein SBA5_340015 [Candidatus Sulfotelmatomonas gaucii]|uniref:Uncharacterized protein n=1 Tax=Candidatus Sulfuritelmatomonas gaucii TaxID=2043161 RepID=A0A2N9LGU2_9BACT|nr:hypothetical protein SBA5_340015 [Candidatus Sulfotelmatomonas gaucii]
MSCQRRSKLFGAWSGSRDRHQHDDGCEDQQVGIEEDEDAGVVQAPSTLQAASRFGHAPRREEQGKDLPRGTVKVLDIREACKPQAGQKCSYRQNDGAHK